MQIKIKNPRPTIDVMGNKLPATAKNLALANELYDLELKRLEVEKQQLENAKLQADVHLADKTAKFWYVGLFGLGGAVSATIGAVITAITG